MINKGIKIPKSIENTKKQESINQYFDLTTLIDKSNIGIGKIVTNIV